ncbi:MAG: putative glycosyl transferase [Acidimicrobiales bacterium]|nr:putative glycosyl transferase [Acidimicrobiales bacterium]
MRLLFVAWRDVVNAQAGGSEQMVDALARELTARGHDVAVMTAGPIGAHDYPVVANGGEMTQYALAPLAYARQFRDRDLVIDVANGIPFFVAAWRDKPSICLIHHIHTDQWSQRFSKPMAALGRSLERHAMPRVYRDRSFLTVSSSTRDGLEAMGVDPARIQQMFIGVDLPADTGTPSAEPTFLALGRMVPHKRFDRLFDLWPEVHARVGGRLVIAGEGPRLADLQRRPVPTGLEVLGRIDEERKVDLLNEAWALVHPSEWEGWGIVIMEAAAHGVPTVGYRVKGVQDAVDDGVTGLLAETDEEFVARWIQLGEDRILRDDLGTAARKRAADYSWATATDQFLEIAEAAVAAAPSNRSSRVAPPGEPTLPRYHVVEQWGTAADVPALSIVIPAYNEAQRLPIALPRLREAIEGHDDWEVILVDDNSTDATVSVAADLLSGLPRCRVLQLDRHRGKGAAVRAGVADALGDNIMFMDADMATDLEHLNDMVGLLERHDAVIGSRYAPGAVTAGYTPSRDNVSRLFLTMSRNAMGIPLSDFQCGFKGFRAPVARVVFHLMKEPGWAFDVELLALTHAVGADIHEMPVRWSSVQGSHLKILSDSAKMVRDLGRIAKNYGRSASLYLLELHDVELTDELRIFFTTAAPSAVVAALDGDVLVLLPFTDRAGADLVSRTLRAEMPGSQVRLRLLPVEELLSPRLHRQREALLAASGPR